MIYLDNCATTKPYKEVLETFVEVNDNYYGNPASINKFGKTTNKLLDAARKQVADILKVKKETIYFTSCATESNNIAIIGSVEHKKDFGNRIIVSKIEHPSVLETYRELERRGFILDYLNVDSNGLIDLNHLKSLLTKETILLSVMHVNNVYGGVQPIKEIVELLKEYPKAEIIPVDSEHSALFQSLQGFKKENVKKLIITASGGTFRGKTLEFLENVTVEEALKHTNWSMGKKITIDSSTLVNKGLEVIEAHELFNVAYDDIEVVVHPQSIIHSMVEYVDGSIIAQMGVPSMKTPILYAFSYPEKEFNASIDFLDLIKTKTLTFEEADRKVFKGIDLAYRAGRTGETMPTVFNAANEVAVELFMKKKIKFLDIYRIIEEAMDSHKLISLDTDEALSIIKEVDKETRKKVREQWEK